MVVTTKNSKCSGSKGRFFCFLPSHLVNLLKAKNVLSHLFDLAHFITPVSHPPFFPPSNQFPPHHYECSDVVSSVRSLARVHSRLLRQARTAFAATEAAFAATEAAPPPPTIPAARPTSEPPCGPRRRRRRRGRRSHRRRPPTLRAPGRSPPPHPQPGGHASLLNIVLHTYT